MHPKGMGMSTCIDRLSSQVFRLMYRKILNLQSDPLRTQNIQLNKLLSSLSGTSLAKDLHLDCIHSYDDYLKKLEVRHYDFYQRYIECVAEGKRDVLYHGRTRAFIVTSGTTGRNDKIIPCNDSVIAAFHDLQRKTMVISNREMNHITLSTQKLIYGSHPVFGDINGVPKGYVSGMLSVDMPAILRRHVFPSQSTLCIDDWQMKVEAIARETEREDIRVVAAVPAYFVNLAKSLCAFWRIESLQEVWPNLELMIYSGTSIFGSRDIIDRLIGKPLLFLGSYLSTEAPIGFQMHVSHGQSPFYFNLDGVVLSFSDIDHPSSPTIGVDQLKEGGEYLVNVGMPNGLLQFAVDDYIRVVSVEPMLTFEIQGRLGGAINLSTEKISNNDVNKAVALIQERTKINIDHWFVYPSRCEGGTPRYEWVFAVDQPGSESETVLRAAIDRALMEISEDYQDLRYNDSFIAPPLAHSISSHMVRTYFINNHVRGQLKVKTSFADKDEFIHFAAEAFPEWAGVGG